MHLDTGATNWKPYPKIQQMSVWKKNGRQHARKSLGLVYQELMSTINQHSYSPIVCCFKFCVTEAVYTPPDTEHKMDFHIENEHEFGLSSSP